MNAMKEWRGALALVGCIATAAAVTASYGKTHGPLALPPQDVISLDRRLSMMEQRLVNMEGRINRLEQQASYTDRRTPSMGTDARTAQLGADIGRLRISVDEIECNMAKLDQRTLPESVREKLDSGRLSDPCRQSSNTPVQFSVRH